MSEVVFFQMTLYSHQNSNCVILTTQFDTAAVIRITSSILKVGVTSQRN